MYAARHYKTQFVHTKEAIFEIFDEPSISPPTAVLATADEMRKLIYTED